MLPIFVDPAWSSRFPGARMGLLEARNLEPLTPTLAWNKPGSPWRKNSASAGEPWNGNN